MGRVSNIVISLAALIVLAPVLIFAAIWIKIASPGPWLFKQQRVGRDGKLFDIYKLRTMHVATERAHTGSVTVENDPRLFRGARLLRKTKLDELPQLLNVLEGSMALVGPRPTVREDYDRMNETQRGRFACTPGLTGLAQISGNTSLSWPERIEFDLDYIRNRSFFNDIKILVKTALLILTNRAETHPGSADEWQKP
ncbi:MAG: sugar transferase [Pseudomonadota bacterium]